MPADVTPCPLSGASNSGARRARRLPHGRCCSCRVWYLNPMPTRAALITPAGDTYYASDEGDRRRLRGLRPDNATTAATPSAAASRWSRDTSSGGVSSTSARATATWRTPPGCRLAQSAGGRAQRCGGTREFPLEHSGSWSATSSRWTCCAPASTWSARMDCLRASARSARRSAKIRDAASGRCAARGRRTPAAGSRASRGELVSLKFPGARDPLLARQPAPLCSRATASRWREHDARRAVRATRLPRRPGRGHPQLAVRSRPPRAIFRRTRGAASTSRQDRSRWSRRHARRIAVPRRRARASAAAADGAAALP